jgi:hypothetical protein
MEEVLASLATVPVINPATLASLAPIPATNSLFRETLLMNPETNPVRVPPTNQARQPNQAVNPSTMEESQSQPVHPIEDLLVTILV